MYCSTQVKTQLFFFYSIHKLYQYYIHSIGKEHAKACVKKQSFKKKTKNGKQKKQTIPISP